MNNHEFTSGEISGAPPTNRSIMVAVNGGASAWLALDWAAAEASSHRAPTATKRKPARQ